MTVVQTAVDGSTPDWVDPWPSSYAGRQTNLPVTGMQPPRGLRVDLQLAVAEDEPGLSYKHYDREPIPRKGFDAFEDE